MVPLELALELEVWLAISVFASWPSILTNCSLVLLLWWSFDCEQAEELGLLDIRLVAGVSSQLGSLSIEIILRLEIGKTV